MSKDEKRLGIRPDKEIEPKPVSRRKSTKRWCKGKAGREHQPELVKAPAGWRPDCELSRDVVTTRGVKPEQVWFCCHLLRCSVCLKHLDPWPDCPDLPAGVRQWMKP